MFDSDDQVVGVATMSNDPIASAFAALIREKGKLTREQIEYVTSVFLKKQTLIFNPLQAGQL